MRSAERVVIEIEGRCGRCNLFGMNYFYLRTGSMFGWKDSWFALWCPTRLTRFSDFDAEALGGAISFPPQLLSMTKMPCYTVAVCLQVVLAR